MNLRGRVPACPCFRCVASIFGAGRQIRYQIWMTTLDRVGRDMRWGIVTTLSSAQPEPARRARCRFRPNACLVLEYWCWLLERDLSGVATADASGFIKLSIIAYAHNDGRHQPPLPTYQMPVQYEWNALCVVACAPRMTVAPDASTPARQHEIATSQWATSWRTVTRHRMVRCSGGCGVESRRLRSRHERAIDL